MRRSPSRQGWWDVVVGVGFLLPNIVGFLCFTFLPLILSLILAFSNWDLRLHNMFKQEPLRFIGFDNFVRMAGDPDFWRYLGNTLFLMMAIPFGIAGSLGAALLLSQDLGHPAWIAWMRRVSLAVLVLSLLVLAMLGAGVTAMTLLLASLAGLVLVGGAAGGSTVYRTLFYLPHFTAGVATYILWKKLYSPETGPINAVLRPVLEGVEDSVLAVPAGVPQAMSLLLLGLLVFLTVVGTRWLLGWHREGESGGLPVLVAVAALTLPCWVGGWGAGEWRAVALLVVAVTVVLWAVISVVATGQTCRRDEGVGGTVLAGVVWMVGGLALLGLSRVFWGLPEMASGGLEPPNWLSDTRWAKPALMIMMLWAAIGSNNMLLYLAGLSNVPGELYEAASIDGAGHWDRFWHVTWPQLAPITFFIVIMSVIAGLQGGFEMARTMTEGGPAGATTTLSYYIYIEGFETGRLGYAASVTWTLFAMVFVLTMMNWTFGNRFVND